MSVVTVLAAIALLLAVLALFPPTSNYPLTVVAVILLAVALLVPAFVR